MPDKQHYRNLSWVFIILISLPAFQMITRFFPEKKLAGVWEEQKQPEINWNSLYSTEYQTKLNRYIEQQYGFRSFFTRLYNQIDYSLFGQPHGQGIVIGKNGFLFEEWFITSYFGQDYAGDQQVALKTRWIRQVQSYLQSQGKQLLVVVSPSKTEYFPEFIPDRLRVKPGKTNYAEFTASFLTAGIPVLDLNRHFKAMKDTASCPLFPKSGTHWSKFGALSVMDTLAGFIGSATGKEFPAIRLTGREASLELQYPDNDLEQLMNLFFPPPSIPMCYPRIEFDDPGRYSLPSAIVIGDSFFWDMFNVGLSGKLFRELKYWYYNSSIFPDSYTSPVKTDQLEFPEAWQFADLIILMANPANIQNIGWGFIERIMMQIINPAWQKEYEKMVMEYVQAIRNTPEWEQDIERKARDKGISKDSQMLLDARYMVEQYIEAHGGL